MKYKVGDKVRIKSREWYDVNKNKYGDAKINDICFNKQMSEYCGDIVTIKEVYGKGYYLEEVVYYWTDEMFEGLVSEEKPLTSTDLIKDIVGVIKTHNLGVSISENEGRLIIEPLEVEKKEDLPIDTPCMCKDKLSTCWTLRYYAYKGRVFTDERKSSNGIKAVPFDYIIPCSQFNFENPAESLQYNIENNQ